MDSYTPPWTVARIALTLVVGLAWSYDHDNYAGTSVATGSVSFAGQVNGHDPGKKGYLHPPRCPRRQKGRRNLVTFYPLKGIVSDMSCHLCKHMGGNDIIHTHTQS
jgi:hypothetical protein